MKRFLSLLAILLLLGSAAVMAEVIYQEDFEAYEVGTQMAEQEGWAFFNNFDGNTTVITNAPGIEGKAMELSQGQGTSTEYVMVFTPQFDLTVPATKLVKVSAKVVMGSNTDLFAIYDKNGNRYFYLMGDQDSCTLESYPSGVSFTNLFNDGTANEISFTFDPLGEKFVAAECNGQSQECSIASYGTCEQPSKLRLSTQLTSMGYLGGTYYDDLKVETINKSESAVLLCADETLIPLDTESVEFPIYNGGPEDTSITYSVSTDGSWLEVTPESGTFNASETLTLKAKEGLEEGFYTCNMTVDGGAAGTQVVSVNCSNGNVIFEENFDDMEDGNIVGQKGGWTVDSGSVDITNAYDCSGKCMFMHRCGGSYACSRYLPKPWYENLIIKVSYDLYWPSDSDCQDSYVLMKDNGQNEKFEGQFMPTYPDGLGIYMIKRSNKDGSEQEKRVKNFPLSPFDTWNRVEYVLDLQSQKLLSFSIGENVTNFVDWPLMNQGCNFFNSWGHSAWNGEYNGSRVAVDNLKIERVKREADPELVVDKFVSIGLDNSINYSVRNGGAGSFDFTAEVLDLDDAVTLSQASGTVESSVDINVAVNREVLEDNYYRFRVRVDAGEAGCATTIFAFVSGNVYYFADFEAPFFTLGDFAGQDEWVDDNGGENIAYICSTNDQQTLYMEYGGNWGGYMHSLEVPANMLVKFEFDFFVPPAIFEDPEWLNQNLVYLKQNSKTRPSCEFMLRPDLMDGVPIVYAFAGSYDQDFCLTEYPYDWMHCSYVIDYLEGNVVEFSIDDNTFTTDEIQIDDAGKPVTLFCICGAYGANLQYDNVKVSVVPEPAALALLALLGLFLKRR